MIRLIVQSMNAAAAANVGGPVCLDFRTFDIELPELEAVLLQRGDYMHAQVIGAEIVATRLVTEIKSTAP